MVARRRKVVISDGDFYQCEACGAMVFVLRHLHDMLCKDYQKSKELVDGSHKIFREIYPMESEAFYQERAKREKNQETRTA